LSYYNFSDSTLSHNVFKTANNRPLGDVFQSMEVFNDKAYLVVNNSGKIEVVDIKDFKSIATISGLTSPRHFLPVNNSKAYVTDLYANAVSVVDLNTYSISKKIPFKGFSEELILSNNKVFVTNIQSDKIFVIDPSTDLVTDSITLTIGPNSIKKDINGKLWVLCSGSKTQQINGGLYKINPKTLTVEAQFPINNTNGSPYKLCINKEGNTLYYLQNGVEKFSVNQTTITEAPFIETNGAVFYGLEIDPATGNIFVADAIDYVQKGKVLIYNTFGKQIQTFEAGIIPGGFYFHKE
jgi:YVTN family beta-propeller protein